MTAAAEASVWRFVWGGALAALVAAAGNLWWFGAFTRLTGRVRPDILSSESILIATVPSVLLAAGVYLLLSRALAIATPLYVLGTLAVAGATTVAPLAPMMPDGTPTPDTFPLLAMPMHVWAGVCAAVVIPLTVHLGPGRPRGAAPAPRA